MTAPLITAILFLSGTILLFTLVMGLIFKSARNAVEQELSKYADDDEKQAEIRKRLVKAMFPPRFDR